MATKVYEKAIANALGRVMQKKEQALLPAGQGLEKYQELKEKKESMDILFSVGDAEGNLLYIDNHGILLILPSEEVQKSNIWYSKETRAVYVGKKSLKVVVDEIRAEENKVVLKSIAAQEIRQAKYMEEELVRDFQERQKDYGTDAYEPITVPGIIKTISQNGQFATVMLLGLHTRGTIYVSRWSKGFTRVFPKEIESDGVIRYFDITNTRLFKGRRTFELSAERHNPDPWDSLPEDVYTPGAVVSVSCVEKPAGKQYWWGQLEGIRDLEVMGKYPSERRTFQIEVGRTYSCTVYKIDKEARDFQVTPFGVIHMAESI